jgi:hypothetical protein
VFDAGSGGRFASGATVNFSLQLQRRRYRLSSAFLLDADPVQARSRKPEYPLKFLRLNRTAYLDLADVTGHLSVVPPLPVSQMTGYVMNKVAQAIHRHSSAGGMRSRSGFVTATSK